MSSPSMPICRGENAAAEADRALQILKGQGVDAYPIGGIIESEDKITIE